MAASPSIKAPLERSFKFGELILTFALSREIRESFIGSLHEEVVTKILPAQGVTVATLYYWKNVIAAIVQGVPAFILKILGIAELWKKLSGH